MTDAVESEKLQKVLARAGLGSRRELEGWISEGRVQINGAVAQLGDRVGAADQVAVDGRPVRLAEPEAQLRRVLIYHKPEAEICSRRDPEGRPSVFASLPRLTGARWIAIGRLDFNTSGLLLFTTDGELANGLMHPSAGIDREYLCRVLGEVDQDMLTRLRTGVLLDDGMARFTDITASGGARTRARAEVDGEGSANQWYTVCVVEGRNREVRRLWESQGVQVSRLKRVRFGPIFLQSRLKQGRFEDLPKEQVIQLYQAAGLPVPVLTTYKDKPRGPKRTARAPQERSPARQSRGRKAESSDSPPRRSRAPLKGKTLGRADLAARSWTPDNGAEEGDKKSQVVPTRRRTPRGLRRPRP